jgi:hypothetical protein
VRELEPGRAGTRAGEGPGRARGGSARAGPSRTQGQYRETGGRVPCGLARATTRACALRRRERIVSARSSTGDTAMSATSPSGPCHGWHPLADSRLPPISRGRGRPGRSSVTARPALASRRICDTIRGEIPPLQS